MTTPRLNRIFTVTGSSTETQRAHIPWGFHDNRGTGFVDGAPGRWIAFSGFSVAPPDNALASVYAAMVDSFNLNPQSVNAGGSDQADVPRIGDLLNAQNREDDGHWVRLSLADDLDSYVQWTVTEAYLSGSGEIRLNVPDDSGVLVGNDFPISRDSYVVFRFELREADQSVETIIARPVWGALLERGSALGVIDVTTTEGGITTTGSQEETTALARYDPSLAIGTALVDDLERQWTIRGSRTLLDRRYLEFDLTRQVLGIG